MRRVLLVCICTMFVLAGCGGWTVEPLPYLSPSPYPTATPIIFSPTPIILLPPLTLTATSGTPTFTPSATAAIPLSATSTLTATVTATSADSGTAVSSTPAVVVSTKVLGCNTSLDITHGMGEVTNAYVKISNVGGLPLHNLCATLQALDEGRPHPDKTKCVALLPAGYQVTERLTVDTTFKEASPIQVEIDTDGSLLQRVGQTSCPDLGLLPPDLSDLGVVTPMSPVP